MSWGLVRHRAQECLERAKRLLCAGDEASVRYACLELRFAIEYVCYQHLYSYLEEMPDDAVRKWPPRQVIAEMLSVDPNAEKTATYTISEEGEAGKAIQEQFFVGEDRRFSLKWAHSFHNALGNFLHASTIHQIESGAEATLDKMKTKADEVVLVLEEALSPATISANFGVFHTFDCDCGRHIKRRVGSFADGITCP
ncbi:hypothetical protein [Roseomonas sp. WA12]